MSHSCADGAVLERPRTCCWAAPVALHANAAWTLLCLDAVPHAVAPRLACGTGLPNGPSGGGSLPPCRHSLAVPEPDPQGDGGGSLGGSAVKRLAAPHKRCRASIPQEQRAGATGPSRLARARPPQIARAFTATHRCMPRPTLPGPSISVNAWPQLALRWRLILKTGHRCVPAQQAGGKG